MTDVFPRKRKHEQSTKSELTHSIGRLRRRLAEREREQASERARRSVKGGGRAGEGGCQRARAKARKGKRETTPSGSQWVWSSSTTHCGRRVAEEKDVSPAAGVEAVACEDTLDCCDGEGEESSGEVMRAAEAASSSWRLRLRSS